LDAAGRDARALAGARIACVGAVTAAALGPRLRADVIPRHGDAAATAAAVIAAAGPAIAGTRVLLPRAAEGRDEAADALRAAGAAVDLLPLYRSVPADPADPALAYGLGLVRAGRIDALACFAPSQARALAALLGADAAALLGRCGVIAAIGNATRAALTELGLAVHVVPPAPDAAALAAAIAAAFQENR
ncbi:MAG TPA: uroporphyrinogen-III synthase, partial [Kofleriaceae bacterium]|nr:uroporphyrinogen-III synthase [Kofleriaceae bacterium]